MPKQDVATRGDKNLPVPAADISGLRKQLGKYRENAPKASQDTYLKMTKAGQWRYGADGVRVSTDSRAAIDPRSIVHGWVCWTRYPEEDRKKNEKLGERMVPFTQDRPAREQLPDTGWDWAEQVGFGVRFVFGPDKGEQTSYTTNSFGGVQAHGRLVDAILEQIESGSDKVVPIVKLSNSSYDHKQWGETFNPEFEVVDWVTLDDNAWNPDDGGYRADADEDEDDGPSNEAVRSRKTATKKTAAKKTAAKKTAAKKAKPKPEPEEVEEVEDDDAEYEENVWASLQDSIEEVEEAEDDAEYEEIEEDEEDEDEEDEDERPVRRRRR